jgi:hypothetical protein
MKFSSDFNCKTSSSFCCLVNNGSFLLGNLVICAMGVGHENWLVIPLKKTNSLLWTQTQRFLLKSLVVYDIGLGRNP